MTENSLMIVELKSQWNLPGAHELSYHAHAWMKVWRWFSLIYGTKGALPKLRNDPLRANLQWGKFIKYLSSINMDMANIVTEFYLNWTQNHTDIARVARNVYPIKGATSHWHVLARLCSYKWKVLRKLRYWIVWSFVTCLMMRSIYNGMGLMTSDMVLNSLKQLFWEASFINKAWHRAAIA